MENNYLWVLRYVVPHKIFIKIHHMCSSLKSELCIFYLDDGTLGGLLSDVLHDVEMIKKEAGIVGLELNPQKSEVVHG